MTTSDSLIKSFFFLSKFVKYSYLYIPWSSVFSNLLTLDKTFSAVRHGIKITVFNNLTLSGVLPKLRESKVAVVILLKFNSLGKFQVEAFALSP